MKLLKEVLTEIKPTVEEEKDVKEKIDDFVSKLNKNLKDAKALLGGSGAKGTWLGHTYDADIFVQFNYNKYKNKSDKLSDILEKVLKKVFGKLKRLHGSRDYFQISMHGFTFEIVPILKINKAKDAMNITDVSPLHSDWVKKYKKYADDIRLTKQFLKAHRIYGAESHIKGFSGYIAEVLTIRYGGFLKLMKSAAKWDEKIVIDTEKYYKNKNDVLMSINKSKQQGPMILIDPVQKDRNAAAALNKETYSKFINICKSFLKKPSKKFFEITEFDLEELKKKTKKNKLIVLEAKAFGGKTDVVGSKLLKAVNFIKKGLEKEEFKVYDYGWDWNKKVLFWFIVDKKLLPAVKEVKGPPVKMEKQVIIFKKKHKNNFIKQRSVFGKDKRKFRDAEKLVRKLIKDKYVKERVKEISFKKI